MILTSYVNGVKAIGYVKDNLGRLNAVCDAVVNSLDSDDGEFFTFLDDRLDQFQLHSFTSGGVAKGVRALVANLLHDSFSKIKGVTSLFDNANCKLEDCADEPLF